MGKLQIEAFAATELGDLPTSWTIERLGDVFEVKLGKMLSQKSKTGRASHPYIRNANVQWGRVDVREVYEMDFNEEEQKRFRLVPGDILMCEGGEPGRTAIWRGELPDCYYQKAVHRLRPIEDRIDAEFFMYHMMNALLIKDYYGVQGTATTIAHLPAVKLKALSIPVPPLPEQQAIACVLRTVQKAKEATEKVIAASRRVKQSLMRHLFTYGPVPFDQADKVELKEAEFGPVPEDWATKRLGDLTTLQSGGTPPRNCPDYFVGSVPWVKTLDLAEGWVRTTEETISEEGLQSIRGKIRPLNTVMVAMYGGAGTVGKAGILGISAATNQAVCCIEPSPHFDSFYLLSFMVMIRSQWMRYAIGTRKDPNIGKGIVERASIPLPTLATQKEIGAMCATIDSKLDTETARHKALATLFNTLLHDLMTGKVRVV